MGGSKSSTANSTTSTSTVTTNTRTDQYDQRVAATEQGLALGTNAAITITTNNDLPPEAAQFVQELVNTNTAISLAALDTSQGANATVSAAQRDADNANRILIVGLGGIGLLALIFVMGRSK